MEVKDDEEVEIFVFSFMLNEDGENGELFLIEIDEEWDMIEEILNMFLVDEDEE